MSVSSNERRKTQQDFFGSLSQPQKLLELFDCLPGVYLFIKDREGRYVQANRVMCKVVGISDPLEIVGKTDFDFFPPAIAAQYVDEDQTVFATGTPLIEKRWPVPGANGMLLWYVCTKLPLFDRRQKVVGIAGVKRP